MNPKLILVLALVMLALGCTDEDAGIISASGGIQMINFSENWTTAPDDLEEGIDVTGQEHTTKIPLSELWTAAPDDNIRSATLHYNAGGKEWKYITMYNATCHEIPCGFEGAYCLECEELNEGD